MTDDTISRLGKRLGSDGFTPPKPIELGEPKRTRVPRPRDASDEREPADTFAPPPALGNIFREQSAPMPNPVPEPISVPEPEPDLHFDVEPEEPLAFEAHEPEEITATPAQTTERSVSLKKRLAFLAAIIAVPAFAASGNIGDLPGPAPSEAEMLAALGGEQPMPFEQAGMSFPGSAFYYVDDSSEGGLVALPSGDPTAFGGEFGRDIGQIIDAGPPASGFFVAGSAASQARAKQCLSQAIYYEAGPGNEAGQRAIAQVVLNRVAHPNWPGSVCGVVYDGAQRSSGCKFTFTCDGRLSRRPEGSGWSDAQQVATEALNGKVFAPIGLATHFHTRFANPAWAQSLKPIGTIGAHQFYRANGEDGEKSAFTGTYAGIEPDVSGNTRRAQASVPASSYAPPPRRSSSPTPRRTPRPPAAAERMATPSPAPSAAPSAAPPAPAPAVPRSGSVKPEYSNAGQWKKRPNDAGQTPPASSSNE